MPPPVQTAAKEDSNQHEVFNYKTLRLLVGIVALLLPLIVFLVAWMWTGKSVDSISASYWVDQTRDLFVGALFVIATLMAAYNGHDPQKNNNNKPKTWHKRIFTEGRLSRAAALGAIGVALFPTTRTDCYDALNACTLGETICKTLFDTCRASCDRCGTDWITVIHYVAAIAVFGVITYFCLVHFYDGAIQKAEEADENAKNPEYVKEEQEEIAKKARQRAKWYYRCGVAIVLSLLLAIANPFLNPAQYIAWLTLLVGEWAALWAFGIAWFIASHASPFEHEKNRYSPFS